MAKIEDCPECGKGVFYTEDHTCKAKDVKTEPISTDETLVNNVRNYKYRGGSYRCLNDACDALADRLASQQQKIEKLFKIAKEHTFCVRVERGVHCEYCETLKELGGYK